MDKESLNLYLDNISVIRQLYPINAEYPDFVPSLNDTYRSFSHNKRNNLIDKNSNIYMGDKALDGIKSLSKFVYDRMSDKGSIEESHFYKIISFDHLLSCGVNIKDLLDRNIDGCAMRSYLEIVDLDDLVKLGFRLKHTKRKGTKGSFRVSNIVQIFGVRWSGLKEKGLVSLKELKKAKFRLQNYVQLGATYEDFIDIMNDNGITGLHILLNELSIRYKPFAKKII